MAVVEVRRKKCKETSDFKRETSEKIESHALRGFLHFLEALARRPLQVASTEDVQVDVKNGLS